MGQKSRTPEVGRAWPTAGRGKQVCAQEGGAGAGAGDGVGSLGMLRKEVRTPEAGGPGHASPRPGPGPPAPRSPDEAIQPGLH